MRVPCTCPDPKCRVHWRVSKVGGWRVTHTDPNWGRMSMTFHPDDLDLARWNASLKSTEPEWVEPVSEAVSS